MVSEALSSQPDFEPQIIEFAQQNATQEQVRKQTRKYLCPRCNTKLIIGYDEPECATCGYVDYEYEPPVIINDKSILSSATKYILRYIGDFENLSNNLYSKYIAIKESKNPIISKSTHPPTNKKHHEWFL